MSSGSTCTLTPMPMMSPRPHAAHIRACLQRSAASCRPRSGDIHAALRCVHGRARTWLGDRRQCLTDRCASLSKVCPCFAAPAFITVDSCTWNVVTNPNCDNAGLSAVEFQCANGTAPPIEGSSFGSWSSWVTCPSGSVITGTPPGPAWPDGLPAHSPWPTCGTHAELCVRTWRESCQRAAGPG